MKDDKWKCVLRCPVSSETSVSFWVSGGPFGVDEIENVIEVLRLQLKWKERSDAREKALRVAGMVLDCWHKKSPEEAEATGAAMYACMNELQTALARAQ